MSEFFVDYPQISYNISGTKPAKLKTVINLMEKAKLKMMVKDDIVAYFPYSIMEGERPDHVSKKIYGNVKYTWLIFLINNMSDPIYDWPLGTREFGAYVKNKYGLLATAKSTIHHYEQILRTRVEATGTTEAIPEAIMIIDETTYDTLAVGARNIKYCYDWEVDRNEAKRNIKLINRNFVADILTEHAEKLG